MAGIGPVSEHGMIRSISANFTSWEAIPVGRLVALASFLSQLPGAKGNQRDSGGVKASQSQVAPNPDRLGH